MKTTFNEMTKSAKKRMKKKQKIDSVTLACVQWQFLHNFPLYLSAMCIEYMMNYREQLDNEHNRNRFLSTA